jgi:FSR family fosmidomycin resistance protein-like MFS transporter
MLRRTDGRPENYVSDTSATASSRHLTETTAFAVLCALSFCHLLNDMMQSLLPAIYPILKSAYALDFGQIGLITLTNQLTASLLQPVIGSYTDRRPKPYSLAIGMGFTLSGLILLSIATHFLWILLAAGCVGIGSAVFHPESSRIARLASGGRHGFAQSLFQVGGNAGSSLGPLLAAFIVLPHGQSSIAWFSLAALVAIGLLWNIGNWYRQNASAAGRSRGGTHEAHHGLSRRQVAWAIFILLALIFSKYIYLASLSVYYTFYLISKFHVSVKVAQLMLFAFLGAVAAGTIIGGPVGDRLGRKYVIWVSILGVLPFTLMLPYANLFWTGVLSVIIGVILASAFSAILVYAQELLPGNVGMVSGLFFGFAFGIGGIGAAALGKVADHTSVAFVYQLCAFLPAIGILTAFLPNLETRRSHAGETKPGRGGDAGHGGGINRGGRGTDQGN